MVTLWNLEFLYEPEPSDLDLKPSVHILRKLVAVCGTMSLASSTTMRSALAPPMLTSRKARGRGCAGVGTTAS